MKQVTTIGLDLAKTVFQVHGVDALGVVTLRRAVRRRQVLAFFAKLPPCLIGMEACATAHYWAREIGKALRVGHAQAAALPVEVLDPCRERWGISYYVIFEPYVDAFAPVVARLARG